MNLSCEQLNCQKDYPQLLVNIRDYLEMEFASEIWISQLANRFHICVGTLFGLFKRYLDMPPMAYLIDLRLKHAERLLLESENTIKETAALCGYENQLYFSQQFSKKFGVSPSAYRARDQNRT